jgi:hypothetical protein
MAITIIILTPVRLTASTDLAGLWAECLSAPVPGMAGMVDGVTGGVAAVMAAGPMDVASWVGADMPDAAMPVDADTLVAAELHVAAVGSTVELPAVAAAADSTVAVDTLAAVAVTVAVADMGAGTGKFACGLI